MIANIHRGKKTVHDETAEKLINELKYLRSVVRDVGEGFIIRKEGEIEVLLNCLDALPPRTVHQVSKSWLKELRTLPIKPAKGRLKDLKRIESLLEDLRETVEDIQDSGKSRRVRTCNVLGDEAGPV